MLRSIVLLLAAIGVPAVRAHAQAICAGEQQPGIPPGHVVIQGDIIIPADYCHREDAFDAALWPGGIVPYEFDNNVDFGQALQAANVMLMWEAATAVVFVPRTTQTNWIHIQASTQFNNSFVGMQGGSQVINIVSWNSPFIIAHEFAHALGYWHEQSRPDRDTFVQVNAANISQTACGGPCNHNFAIVANAGAYAPYDFDSVMHYGQFAFSVNGQPTITVLPPNQAWQNLIGQRDHLSFWDQRVMSFLYPEANWRFVDSTLTGSPNQGTFLAPYVNFVNAYNAVPDDGSLFVLRPVTYTVTSGTSYTRKQTWDAPLGGFVIR